jgi:N-acetylmuramoyl-L-alanine amidase
MAYAISPAHQLTGPSVTYDGRGNFTAGVVIKPTYVVIHYTVIDYVATIRSFGPAGARKASAHLVVSRAGNVTQMVDFNRRAWHAGESFWNGTSDLNTHSVGIELENHGYLQLQGDGRFLSDNHEIVDPSQVVQARHKNPKSTARYWERYPPEQLDACEHICDALVKHYGIKEIVGHDDVSPGRKSDPGPAFPMERIRSVFGRADAPAGQGQRLVVTVDSLNVRGGPGPDFPLAGEAFSSGTIVKLLEESAGGWSKVASEAVATRVGWVYAAYLAAF